MEFLYFMEELRTPFLDALFQFFTLFGEETLFLVIALVVFWCVDKECGYFLLYVCFLGTAINQFLKIIFRIPRPWVRDPNFTIVESAREAASGYSFPSGHTQSSAGMFLGIARRTKLVVLRVACVALTALVALSRMYLGVHTPADVGVSLLVALVLVFGAYPLFARIWQGARSGGRYAALFATLFAVCIAFLAYVELFPHENAAAQNLISARENAYKLIGGAVAFALVMWLEGKYIKFDTKAVWWAQLIKTALGLGLVIAIRMLTKAPLLALTGGHPAAGGIRYCIMVLFGGAVWPLTFKRISALGARGEEARHA